MDNELNFRKEPDDKGEMKYYINDKPVTKKAYDHMMHEYLVSYISKSKNINTEQKNPELCQDHQLILNFIRELKSVDDSESLDMFDDFIDELLAELRPVFYNEGHIAGQILVYKSMGDLFIENATRMKIMNELAEQGLLIQDYDGIQDFEDE